MQKLGFVHDMMDVKVLILFVTARSGYPMTIQEIYELCYQDDCLSYFDVCTAIPQMVESGHLRSLEDEKYEITPKGRETEALTGDSIAYSVKQRAENAVARFNWQLRRSGFVRTEVIPRENQQYAVVVRLDDERGNLMTLELGAPNARQAGRLEKMLEMKAEQIYNLAMMELLEAEGSLED